MKKHFYAFALLALIPSIALANAGWPGLWVAATTHTTFTKFWYVVIFSLLLEGHLLWYFSRITWWKTALIVILANALSAAAGVGLSMGSRYTDGFMMDLKLSGEQTFIVDLTLVFVISAALESAVVRFFWKAPWKKLLAIMAVSNFITHSTGLTYMVYSLKQSQREMDAEAEEVSNQPRDCAPLGYSSTLALATWSMRNGTKLVVCEVGKTYKPSKDSFRGWVNIYEDNGGKLTPFISEVKSEAISAAYNFSIERLSDATIKITRNVIPLMQGATGEEDIPVSQWEIDCSTSPCKATPEQCLDRSLGVVDEKAIQFVRDVIDRKKGLEDLDTYDEYLGKVVQAAAIGDKRAQKLILDTPEKTLRVDGIAAETLADGKYLLKRLIDIKCLKR